MKHTVRREELIRLIVKDTGLKIKEGRDFYNALIDVIIEALFEGENVNLNGFGNFSTRVLKEYKMFHPRKKELIPLPTRWKVTFVPSKCLKKLVQHKKG